MSPRSDLLLVASSKRRDRGRLVGRDPRLLTDAEHEAAGLLRRTPMRAIRAYCLDCAGGPAEARKCVAIGCPLWPLRMGTWPHRLRRPNPPPDQT